GLTRQFGTRCHCGYGIHDDVLFFRSPGELPMARDSALCRVSRSRRWDDCPAARTYAIRELALARVRVERSGRGFRRASGLSLVAAVRIENEFTKRIQRAELSVNDGSQQREIPAPVVVRGKRAGRKGQISHTSATLPDGETDEFQSCKRTATSSDSKFRISELRLWSARRVRNDVHGQL